MCFVVNVETWDIIDSYLAMVENWVHHKIFETFQRTKMKRRINWAGRVQGWVSSTNRFVRLSIWEKAPDRCFIPDTAFSDQIEGSRAVSKYDSV